MWKKGDRIEIKNNNHLSYAACFWLPIEPVIKGEKGTVISVEDDERFCRVKLDGHAIDNVLPIKDLLHIA
jgi:hypothetical protein